MNSCIPAIITGLACYSFLSGEQSCFGQIPASSARLVALGQTGAVLEAVHDSRATPASIAELDGLSASFGFNQRFGMAELASSSATLAAPVGSIVVGGSLAAFGYEEYGETALSIGLAAVFGSVRTGIRGRLNRVRFAGYESRGGVTVDLGWQYIVEPVLVGAVVTGLGSGGMRGDLITIQTGIAVRAGPDVLLAASVEQTRDVGPDYRFGMEVSLGILSLRFGGTGRSRSATAGFGLDIAWIEVDAAVSTHPRLGLSPIITVTVGD